MFLNYNEFLNESVDLNRILNKAIKLYKKQAFKQALLNCEEGKFSHISIIPTAGSNSYIGVALNDGNCISEVFKTSDPKIALLALIIRNINNDSSDDILDIINTDDTVLRYTVFGGHKPMSKEDIIAKYNLDNGIVPGDSIPFYTNTPVIKTIS